MTFAHFDGMSWPSDGFADLERELRYGPHPNYEAADLVAAYADLLFCSSRRRARVVAGIKAAGARQMREGA